MKFLYNIFIRLYYWGIKISSIRSQKAKAWLDGRKNLFRDLEQRIAEGDKVVWVHCSSAGEFEQAKPVIEGLKRDFPHYRILLSFFSPSGMSLGRNYPYADYLCYIPLDTRKNAARFLQIIRPHLVIFVKYEFWFHHLFLASKQAPVLLLSAVFRQNQSFFKWYGKFYRNILFLFNHLYVQDKGSLALLQQYNIHHCSLGGDTRFDRVAAIARSFEEIPFIKEFINGDPVMVAGSTWPEDEEILSGLPLKLILAPHEINEGHLEQIEKRFGNCTRYSRLSKSKGWGKVLIIDNIGMLSRLYQYATLTYIGGGFTKDGIHNALEAAVFGKPVPFGPNYKKYREAKELIRCAGAYSVNNGAELKDLTLQLLRDETFRSKTGNNAGNFIKEGMGATSTFLKYIQEKRLLTS